MFFLLGAPPFTPGPGQIEMRSGQCTNDYSAKRSRQKFGLMSQQARQQCGYNTKRQGLLDDDYDYQWHIPLRNPDTYNSGVTCFFHSALVTNGDDSTMQ